MGADLAGGGHKLSICGMNDYTGITHPGLWNSKALILIPSVYSLENLQQSFNHSKPQFPHLENGSNENIRVMDIKILCMLFKC